MSVCFMTYKDRVVRLTTNNYYCRTKQHLECFTDDNAVFYLSRVRSTIVLRENRRHKICKTLLVLLCFTL